MTAFEKWLGRVDLFYNRVTREYSVWVNFPIASYKNDLRLAYAAGERNERRKEWIKISGRFVRRKSPNYYGTFLEEEA